MKEENNFIDLAKNVLFTVRFANQFAEEGMTLETKILRGEGAEKPMATVVYHNVKDAQGRLEEYEKTYGVGKHTAKLRNHLFVAEGNLINKYGSVLR